MGSRLGGWTETTGARPLVGVLCCNDVAAGRPSQTIANRFVAPVAAQAGAAVLLVPAMPDAIDLARFAGMLDALLLTGGCTHLDPRRYGGDAPAAAGDPGRDEVALRLAGAMIAAGRPVFGICRGLQELNVLFGGTLCDVAGRAAHHADRAGDDLAALFAHGHDIAIAADGALARAAAPARARVNSVHLQGIDRLGAGLAVEAAAPDGLVEAISAREGGARVLGVQWHPEWGAATDPLGGTFFAMLGAAARGGEVEARA